MKQDILKAIKEIKEKSPKKKFSQTLDLQIVLKDLDLKKQEHKVDLFLTLPKGLGKKLKLCALIDKPLESIAKDAKIDMILKEEFIKYGKDKKLTKKLTNQYDFFIAQANIMGEVAKTFGRVFGPRGKMPSPKAEAIVLPVIKDLKPLVEKLKKTIRIQTKNELAIRAAVGKESMNDEDLAENILYIYENLIKKLPQEKHNIKHISLKLTMGPRYLIGQGIIKKDDKA